MNRLSPNTLRAAAAKVKRHVEAIQAQTERLGAEIRETVIIPLCRLHGFEFLSGMGTYYFLTGDRTIDASDAEEMGLKDIVAVFDNVLNIEALGQHTLGMYVSDVRKKDLK